MQFPLLLLIAKNCGNLFYCHYSHSMMDSERAELLAAVLIDLRLMYYICIMYNLRTRCRRRVLAISGLGKKQRLLAASCVFPRMQCFLPCHRF